MLDQKQLTAFAKLVEQQQMAEWDTKGYTHHRLPGSQCCKVTIKPGRKYTKVDVGDSGKYMVENDTGDIYGIKAYGVIHRGHRYGNLSTIHDYYWGRYTAFFCPIKKPEAS